MAMVNVHFTDFQTASTGIYSKVFDGIMRDPNNVVSTTKVGYTKVRHENYAFISDVTPLSKNASNDCRLTLIREKFYRSGYGIVVPDGWPYKKYFDAM